MASNNFDKFIIDIGFEDEEAVKGLKSLLKQIDQTSSKVQDKIKKVSVAETTEIKKQNSLLASKRRLQQKILQASKLGIDTTADRQSLRRAKKAETLNKRAYELEQKIYQLNLKQADSKKTAARTKTQALREEMKGVRQSLEMEIKGLKEQAKERKKQHLMDQRERARKYKQELSKIKVIDTAKRKALQERYRSEEKAQREIQRIEQQRAKEADKERRKAIQHQRQLTKFYRSNDFRMLLNRTPKQAAMFESRAKSMLARGDERGFATLESQIARTTATMRKHTNTMLGMQTVQNGLSDSTRNMVRSFASVYALFAASSSINRTGQNFESLQSAMLAAMGTTEDAAAQIAFLEEMTQRLGLSMLDTADQYTKFTFAAKGKLDTDQVNELFENMSELGLVLGVSKERMKLSFTAIQQMMNKSTVTSEELKRQLAESLPGAIGIFARALGVSEQELFAQMEAGTLLAKDVLPLVAKEMNKVANSGGALELKMKSLRAEQGRFFNSLEMAQKQIFDNGFSEGLASLFDAANDQMKEGTSALKGFGQIFRVFFNVIAGGVRLLTPIMDSFLFVTGKSLTGLFEFFTSGTGKIVAGIGLIGLAFTKLGRQLVKFLAFSPATLILGAIAAADELFAMFDGQREGVLERWLFGENKDFDLKDITAENIGEFTFLLSEKIAEAIKTGFKDAFKDMDAEEIFKELGSKIVNFFANIGESIVMAWSGIMDSFFSEVLNGFSFRDAFNQHFQGNSWLADKAGDLIGSLTGTTPSPINNSLSPVPSSTPQTKMLPPSKPSVKIENNIQGTPDMTPEQLQRVIDQANQKAIESIDSRFFDMYNSAYKAH